MRMAMFVDHDEKHDDDDDGLLIRMSRCLTLRRIHSCGQ